MRAPFRSAWFLMFAGSCSLALAQMPLAEVAKVARQRAERMRPAQQKALEPYWPDLMLDYRLSSAVLDKRIEEVAALGDSVVPLLLEKLSAPQGNDTARHLASNCRRVLEKLDPSSFLDALVELANGSHEIGRTEAIRLLGHAQVAQAVTLLVDLLDRTTGDDKRFVVRSLRLLKATSAAAKVVPMLASNDRMMREEVLLYLLATKPAAVVDTVVQALANERDDKLLPYYIDYFATTVRGHDGAARALVPLLDRQRLDFMETKRLVKGLGTIAPTDHEPTTRKLHELLDNGEGGSMALGVQVALTLRALGDRQGVTKLKRSLDDLIRKRKKEAALYEARADLAYGTDDYTDAFNDFERMLDETDGPAMSRRAYIGLMKCEARRKKIENLKKLMHKSGLAVEDIERIGLDDPVFAETLQQDKVKAHLQQIAKEQAPR
jgi:hypothetical protein